MVSSLDLNVKSRTDVFLNRFFSDLQVDTMHVFSDTQVDAKMRYICGAWNNVQRSKPQNNRKKYYI